MSDYLITRLEALCKRFNADPLKGRFVVSEKSTLSEQYLYQILTGKSRRSEKPRSIGQNARSKLTKAFPDWLSEEFPTPSSDDDTSYKDQAAVKRLRKHTHQRPLVQRLCDIAESMDDQGIERLIEHADGLIQKYPLKPTAKRKSSP